MPIPIKTVGRQSMHLITIHMITHSYKDVQGHSQFTKTKWKVHHKFSIFGMRFSVSASSRYNASLSRCVLCTKKITLAQWQSKPLVLVESPFQASLVLDLINEERFSDEDDIMDVLELTAFKWTKIAIMMSNGRCGPYNISPKSQDFFLISLQAPDHYFCKMFQSVQF